MPAVGTPYLRLSQHQILELSTLGRQLLKYRLSSHRQVAGSRFDAPTFGHEARGIARILGSCLEGDEWWQEQIIAALGDHDEAAKIVLSQGNESAVLEALLVTIHERRTIARVGEITELANGILFARQEKDRLTSKAVGLMLRKALGLGTKRRASGYELKLDSNTCTAIHRSADSHGALSLVKPSADCTFCHDLTPSTPSAVAGEALTVCASRTPRAHVHTTGATTPPLSQPEVVGHD
jgi:hypothetical protein